MGYGETGVIEEGQCQDETKETYVPGRLGFLYAEFAPRACRPQNAEV
jgi:hypothetical protein